MINQTLTIPTRFFTEKQLVEAAFEKILFEYNQHNRDKYPLSMRHATLEPRKVNGVYQLDMSFNFGQILEQASTDLSQKPIDPIEMQRKILRGAA